MAKFVAQDGSKVTFDEIGVHKLSEKFPILLTEAGCKGIPLEILSCFSKGLGEVFKNLLSPDHIISREDYEIKARILLGFQFVIIFGTSMVTPSVKQIVSYVSYYIQKAKEDGQLVGLPLTIRNYSDGLMETIHKRAKNCNILFSGGKKGPITAHAYQKQVLKQIFINELLTLENNTYIHLAKEHKSGDMDNGPEAKKPKVEVSVTYHV